MVKAVNTYAISVLCYSFGVVNWTITDLDRLDRTLRTTLTKHRMHHPRSSIERITIPRKSGGRGFVDIKRACMMQIEQMRTYFYGRQDSPMHAVVALSDRGITPLKLHNTQYSPLVSAETITEKLQKWSAKELHGRYWNSLQGQHIDSEASCSWLTQGYLFPETE